MQLSRYVAPVDLPDVLTQLRRPLKLFGLALLAPLLVSAVFQEWRQTLTFGALAAASYPLGGRKSDSAPALAPRDALVFASLTYLLVAFLGALAYWPTTSFLDGLFESMSGFTTTGLTVLDLSSTPRSLLFFRSYSQWLGGAGIIVLSIVFLPGARSTLRPLYAAEFREENVLGNIVATTRLVFAIYGGLTLLAFAAFFACGMGLFDALLHALATLSTGGFSPYGDSIARYRSFPVELAVAFFMIVGAVAFPLFYRARREGLRALFSDVQLRALLTIIALASSLALFPLPALPEARELFEHAFHVVSAVTTTGFTVSDATRWTEGSGILSIVLMLIGGSAGSTAGGIKIVRFLVLLKTAQWAVRRALLPPESQLPIRLGDRVLRDEDLKSASATFLLYAALLAVSCLLLTATGSAPIDALFESASALGTVGLSAGVTSSDLVWWGKLVLTADMWAGRLEILPLLVLLYPFQWRPKEGSS